MEREHVPQTGEEHLIRVTEGRTEEEAREAERTDHVPQNGLL